MWSAPVWLCAGPVRPVDFDVKEVRVRNEWSKSQGGGCSRALRCLVLAAMLIGLALPAAPPAAAQAQTKPVKGEISTVVDGGYARIVFLFTEEVESQVRVANNILTITFARPVDV